MERVSNFRKAKDCINRTETIPQLREVEKGLRLLYERGDLTENQYSSLDLIWCDRWIELDLGGH